MFLSLKRVWCTLCPQIGALKFISSREDPGSEHLSSCHLNVYHNYSRLIIYPLHGIIFESIFFGKNAPRVVWFLRFSSLS